MIADSLSKCWCDATQAAVDGLVREGLLHTIAEIFADRHGLQVQDEDRLLLRTIARSISGTAPAADGVVPPAQQLRLLHIIESKHELEPFNWLTHDQMRQLVRTAKHVKYEPGRVVTKQGDDDESALIVLSGSLSMHRHVDASNASSDLGRLEEGHMFGMQALLLGEPRSATLTTVDDSTPAEIIEITFASLALLADDDTPAALAVAQRYLELVSRNHNNNRVGQGEEDSALLCSAHQILCAQARRGIVAVSQCFPRLVQVLLDSMPTLSKYERALKVDVDVQTQITQIMLYLTTKFPFALQVYQSGLVVPLLRLLSSPEATVARNATGVMEGLLRNPSVCAAIGGHPLPSPTKSQPPSPTKSPQSGQPNSPATAQEVQQQGSSVARSDGLGELLIRVVVKRFSTVASQHHCDNIMFRCLKLLVQNTHTSRLLTEALPADKALRLMQSALGRSGEGHLNESLHIHYTADSITPAVIHSVMSIMEGYVATDAPEGGAVMESEASISWLEGAVRQCQPPDPEVTQRYIRIASRCRGRSQHATLEDLPPPPSPAPAGSEIAKDERREFLNSVEANRHRFSRLLQIAHVQVMQFPFDHIIPLHVCRLRVQGAER